MLAAIRLCVWGHAVKVAAPMSWGSACQASGLSQRAARRLLQSKLVTDALALAQADRDALEPREAPPEPLVVKSPPIEPEPLSPASERDTSPETFTRMIRLGATDERNGALVSAPADFVEPLASISRP